MDGSCKSNCSNSYLNSGVSAAQYYECIEIIEQRLEDCNLVIGSRRLTSQLFLIFLLASVFKSVLMALCTCVWPTNIC